MIPEGALMTTQHRPKQRPKDGVPGDVYYPESDGEPMGETDTHWEATADLTYTLKDRYRDANDVYVASDNFVYYEEGNPRAVFSPDVYVVFGVPKRLRRTYKLWVEGGHAPAVVFEVSSRKTWLEDKGNKMAVCAMLGVREYYLYDPELDYLDPPLQGYRLEGDQYFTMSPDADGALSSEVLGLTLHLDGAQLVLIDTESGERLLNPRESQAIRREQEVAREVADEDRDAADAAREAAELARDAADAARKSAEDEVARLRAELERLRSGSAPASTTT
jgi:Uma2 family endonuclease